MVVDRAGALLEASGAIDAEALGAVYAVLADTLERAGGQLGLGALERASITGRGSACVVALHDGAVVAVELEPGKPITPVEKKLDTALRR